MGPHRGHQTHRDGPRSRRPRSDRNGSDRRDGLGWSRPIWVRARTSNLCAEVRLLPGPYRPSRRRPGAVLRTFFESLLVSREKRAGAELLRGALLAASLLERLLRLLLLLLLRLVRTLAHGLSWTIGTPPDEVVRGAGRHVTMT